MIEDIFSLAVALHIHGGDARQLSLYLQREMIGQPARVGADGAAFLQCAEKFMADKGMIARAATIPLR